MTSLFHNENKEIKNSAVEIITNIWYEKFLQIRFLGFIFFAEFIFVSLGQNATNISSANYLYLSFKAYFTQKNKYLIKKSEPSYYRNQWFLK